MHASPIVPLLHRWLRRACPAVHAVRATAVVTVVEALVLGAKLALTHLGRNLRSAAFAKHSIKRVDRLLGNVHLHQSAVFLGRQLLTSLRFQLPCSDLRRALERLPLLVARYATVP